MRLVPATPTAVPLARFGGARARYTAYMPLVRVLTPQSPSEQAVVVAMLEAHDIPTHVHNGHLRSLLPGMTINAYNSASIMVPAEYVDAAAELIADFRRTGPASGPDHGRLVLRNAFEFLLGGWVVPAGAPPTPAVKPARSVAFHETPEATRFGDANLHFAVMMPRSVEGVVVVYNRFREVWELPGGLIDPGETPRNAAVRELREEAGCEAGNVHWLGVTEVSDGGTHFGAVFECDVEVIEFVANEEMSGLAYWLPDRPPPGLGATDEALLARFGVR